MTGELVNRQTGEIETLSVEDIMQRVNFIREITKSVMQGPTTENPEGVHYGIIPGCKKPTLLKPGAEVLTMTFRLRPIIKEQGEDVKIVELANGHREYVVYCHVFNMAGLELATGVGSCSTMESKYRYRGGIKIAIVDEAGNQCPVPKEYWNLKNESKLKEAQELIGGQGFSTGKINGAWVICESGEKMENPDIADCYNTALKIAKKRSYVDGVLSATGASEHFTQDMEDSNGPNIKPQTKTETKTETKAETKAETKTEPAAKKKENLECVYQSGIWNETKKKSYYTVAKQDEFGDNEYVVIIAKPLKGFSPNDLVVVKNFTHSYFKNNIYYFGDDIEMSSEQIPFGD